MKLRDRDLDILLALAKMRLLRTSDLARLFFHAVGTCQKRLRKLYDAELIRAVVTDLAAENRYALAPLGHALLVEELGESAVPRWRPSPRTDGRRLAHLDLLNRYRVALAKEAPRLGVDLARFAPEWELRAADPRAPIIPDALVALLLPAGKLTLAIEVDTGSEAPAAIAKKARAYREASMMRRPVFGAVAPSILIVTSSARRARSAARALCRAKLGRRVLLGAAPFVLGDGGLSSGLAFAEALASWEGGLSVEAFRVGLLRVNMGVR